MKLERIVSYSASLLMFAAISNAQPLTPRLVVNDLRGNYAVEGTALFGTGSGNITINTVPPTSGTAVKSAYLYWDVLGSGGPPAGANLGTFMGNAIVGTLIGSGSQLDQPQTENYSYWSDVTAFIPLTGGNGTYSLSGFSTATEGASLVLIWMSLPFANRDIVIFDGNGTVNAANPTANLSITSFQASTPVSGAAVAFIVGDGQSALPDNSTFGTSANFNGTLDGNTQPPGIELWDNDNYTTQANNVPAGSTTVPASITRPDNGDSVVWVATPFSVTSPIPAADVTCTPEVRVVPRGQNFQMTIRVESHSGSNVPVTGQVEVRTASGRVLGLMAGPQNGTLQPGSVLVQSLRRRIPNSVPANLIGVPLFVYTQMFQRNTTTLIDDDYVEFIVQ